MTQPLQPLNDDFVQHRARHLAEAERLAGARNPLTAKQIQTVYDSMVKDGESEAGLAIGYALGELIAARGKYEWKVALDYFGSEPVVAGAHGVFCAPVYMIMRRLKEKQPIDIESLVKDTLETMREAIARSGA